MRTRLRPVIVAAVVLAVARRIAMVAAMAVVAAASVIIVATVAAMAAATALLIAVVAVVVSIIVVIVAAAILAVAKPLLLRATVVAAVATTPPRLKPLPRPRRLLRRPRLRRTNPPNQTRPGQDFPGLGLGETSTLERVSRALYETQLRTAYGFQSRTSNLRFGFFCCILTVLMFAHGR